MLEKKNTTWKIYIPKKKNHQQLACHWFFLNESMAVCHVIRKELTETFDFWVAWGTSLEWRYSHVVSQKPRTHPASYVLVVIQLTAYMYRCIGILDLHLRTNWWFGHSEISGHFKSLLLNEPLPSFMRSELQFRNSYPKTTHQELSQTSCTPSDCTPENWHGNGKSPFSIGNTSSKGPLFIAILVYQRVTQQFSEITHWIYINCGYP